MNETKPREEFGVCRECGCTEDRACVMPGSADPPIGCSWADESHTLCTACKFENEALARAGAGILHILKQMEADGLVSPLYTNVSQAGFVVRKTLDNRSQVVAGLVGAYLAGFGEAYGDWKEWIARLPFPMYFDVFANGPPRDITLDIREPRALTVTKTEEPAR
jgi:hypothetical protein